jgi:hypothetical protein
MPIPASPSMLARAEATAAALPGAGMDVNTVCCICKDDTPEGGQHQGLDTPKRKLLLRNNDWHSLTLTPPPGCAPLECGHHFGRDCFVAWVHGKDGSNGHTQCPVRDCGAPCCPEDIPKVEVIGEPEIFVIKIKPLNHGKKELFECNQQTTTRDLKEYYVNVHNTDSTFFNAPDTIGPITIRNIRIAWRRKDLITTLTLSPFRLIFHHITG